MKKRKASKVKTSKVKARKAPKKASKSKASKSKAPKSKIKSKARQPKRPARKAKPAVARPRSAAAAAAPPSAVEARRAGAREIFAYLVREILNVSPANSPHRANPTNLGYAPHLDRGETAERHRIGTEFVRLSRDVILAFGRLERNLPDGQARDVDIPNARPWYSEVEPRLRRGCEKFHRDRFVGILDLVDDVYSLVESRYGAIPLPVAMGLTRATVMAYGYGFFIRYNAQRAGARAR